MCIRDRDDDIVSLTALTLIVNPECREDAGRYDVISQLTLSLYLMTQCQLKLRHSVTSLAQTSDYIKVAHRGHPANYFLDRIVLKMIARKAVTYIKAMTQQSDSYCQWLTWHPMSCWYVLRDGTDCAHSGHLLICPTYAVFWLTQWTDIHISRYKLHFKHFVILIPRWSAVTFTS